MCSRARVVEGVARAEMNRELFVSRDSKMRGLPNNCGK